MLVRSLTTPIVFLALFLFSHCAVISAQSIDLSSTPGALEPGSTVEVPVGYNLPAGGIVQLQLFDEDWGMIASDWVSVNAGTNGTDLTITVPADTPEGGGYFWQGLLYDSGWSPILQDYTNDVTLGPSVAIDFSTTPLQLGLGSTTQVPVLYDLPNGGIVQLQLFDEDWDMIASDWVSVDAGSSGTDLAITVPADTPVGSGYFWQGLLYDGDWGPLLQDYSDEVTLGSSQSSQFDMGDLPLSLASGQTHSITADYTSESGGIVQLCLYDSSWGKVDGDWDYVNAGSRSHTFTIDVPSSESGDDYFWQATVRADDWMEEFKEESDDVTLGDSTGPEPDGDDPLPPGTWVVDWNDEFDGNEFEVPSKWYPFVGTNPESYAADDEKGIRWTDGNDPATAQMYSVKDRHWLDGNGNLILHAVSDKTQQTVHGDKVETAYLMTGYPEAWDNSDPDATVRWAGKFVNPQETPLYISCRVKTNEVVGHSTWFAFWLFSKTRAYNSNPVNGTEVDIIEIAKGPDWLNESFNVANHWNLSGGSESKQFNGLSNPPADFFVDVQDDQFHTYGLEWTTQRMTCYVDGVPCYTFTDNIPSDPVDMMMLLTLEFEVDAWTSNQGDGRVSGPFISNNAQSRLMSRALVDFVRVYKKQ